MEINSIQIWYNALHSDFKTIFKVFYGLKLLQTSEKVFPGYDSYTIDYRLPVKIEPIT